MEKIYFTKQNMLSKQWERLLKKFSVSYVLVGAGIVHRELGMDFFRQAKNMDKKSFMGLLESNGYIK